MVQPDDPNAARLWDMLVHAREIIQSMRGVAFQQYERDKDRRLATERRLEIIGEAARHVSRDFQDLHPEIPWQKIVAFPHVLAHEYGEIKQEIVYRVVTERIGGLIKSLETFVPADASTSVAPGPTQKPIAAIVLCPGQGAQAVGMGRQWCERSPAAKATFDEADRALGDALGAPLSEICFNGPAERLNQTDVSQPAIYACSIASYRGLTELRGAMLIVATAGLSLGEYTALHLAGVFDFIQGLRLVAARGRLMQEAAIASKGGMVALIGADDAQAQAVCHQAAQGQVLVCANYNAPGQIVLSGHAEACQRALQAAEQLGLKAAPLSVAGAFHSALMQPAADRMAQALSKATFQRPNTQVWSNVTAQPHNPADPELLKTRLVQQIVSPVRWSETCQGLAQGLELPGRNGLLDEGLLTQWHELAPGSVLRGLMRRIDRKLKVISHDEPEA